MSVALCFFLLIWTINESSIHLFYVFGEATKSRHKVPWKFCFSAFFLTEFCWSKCFSIKKVSFWTVKMKRSFSIFFYWPIAFARKSQQNNFVRFKIVKSINIKHLLAHFTVLLLFAFKYFLRYSVLTTHFTGWRTAIVHMHTHVQKVDFQHV